MLDTLVRQRHLVRLSVAAVAVIAAGCTGLVDGGAGNLTPEQAQARQAWLDEAQPVIQTNCAACHNGSRQNIAFLEGADPIAQRDDLIGYEPLVVNLTAPQSSRMLTKGLHEGPAFTASQASAVLQWIQKEKDAAGVDGGGDLSLRTEPFKPLICIPPNPPGSADCQYNNVPLDAVGAPGASIRFTVQQLGSGLYLSNLTLQPGPMGAYIEHPLFVSLPDAADAKPDTIDRFFNVKMNLSTMATDEEKQIAGGTAAFVGFSAQDAIAIYFKVVTPFKPDMGMPMVQSGCKALTQFEAVKANFTTAVAGAAFQCNQCHGGGQAGATGAMSTQGIAQTGAALQNTCNQILIRVNLTTPDQSGIFLAPSPGSTHPQRFTQAQLDTFKANVMPWITAERTAP